MSEKEGFNQHLKKLSKSEKHVICGIMRSFSIYEDCHMGMLPFVRTEAVIKALGAALNITTAPHLICRILSKIGPEAKKSKIPGVTLSLSDNKVYRRFGPHPEYGVVIPGLGTVLRTAGVSFNIGKKDYVPHKERIPLKVALVRLGRNRWRLVRHPQIYESIYYLIDHCGVDPC